MGSLVAAVASYMIAKQNSGRWLVRMENVDWPREVEGAASLILTGLEDFGLNWDGEVVYQNQRTALYQEKFEELNELGIVYQCDCSRKVINKRNNGIYDNFCRERNLSLSKEQAARIKFPSRFEQFYDEIIGLCVFDSPADKQDYVIKRRDGLFAYQLAVVVDDIEQGINQVVRGQDILDSTPRQNYLYHCFKQPVPSYYHLPLVEDKKGIKLSKRTGALAIDKQQATLQLLVALEHLGQKTERAMYSCRPEEIVAYFEKNWQTNKISSIIESIKSNAERPTSS